MKYTLKEFKKVNLIATIFDHSHDEDYEEVVFPILMPNWEWERLIEEGTFSLAYQEVIDGYERYISQIKNVADIYICFEEIQD